MVAGSEIARAIEEFEQSQELPDVSPENPAECQHYDQMKCSENIHYSSESFSLNNGVNGELV